MSFIVVPARWFLAVLALVILTTPVCAQTNAVPAKLETFQLKNGDRITGHVTKEEDDSIRLKTKWEAEVVLPKSEIEKRETAASNVPPATEASVVIPAPNPVPPPPPAVQPPKPVGVWKGKFQIGADMRESTVSSYLYSANARISYTKGGWNTAGDYRYSYGKSGNTLSADRMDGTLKSDLNLGQEKEWFVYALGGAGYDVVRKIDYQFEFGPGLGRHLLVRTNMALNLELGTSYQRQDFSNKTTRDEFRVRLAEDYFWQFSSKLRFEHMAEIQPAFDDPSDYRIRVETTVSYSLFNNVSWNVTVIDLYDSEPAAGVSKNDLQVRSGLGFSF